MIEKQGNLWTDWDSSKDWVVITTNGSINNRNEAIMGKGIALEAKEQFNSLPRELGRLIQYQGNQVFTFPQYGLITFPTKEHYYLPSTIELIENSCRTLSNIFNSLKIRGNILIPRPGCGAGRLKWKDVKPICVRYFTSDQFIVYSR